MLNWFKKKLDNYSRSPKWSIARKEHLKIQPICQACNRQKNLEVHHIIPYQIDKTKELDFNNLITLCDTCHLLFGHLMNYKSWNENVVADCQLFSYKIKNRPYHEENNQDNSSNNWFSMFK